jgi:hypothetical protein
VATARRACSFVPRPLFAALLSGASLADPYAPPGTPLDHERGDFARDKRGRIQRSTATVTAFRAEHPCPSTGLNAGPCPGYVIDHIRALRRGGADLPHNLQWQSRAAAREKDRVE